LKSTPPTLKLINAEHNQVHEVLLVQFDGKTEAENVVLVDASLAYYAPNVDKPDEIAV